MLLKEGDEAVLAQMWFSGCSSACQEPATLPPHVCAQKAITTNGQQQPVFGEMAKGRPKSIFCNKSHIITAESCNKNLLP